MDMTHSTYWDDSNIPPRMKYEGCSSNDEMTRSTKDERGLYQCCETNLNFSTATCSEDDSEYGPYKKNKVTRQDPMSHRIIEKRRRDRMNNCLADLSRLIPTEYLKKGRGRIEKTEIIEMAIKHMKYLQQEHGTPSEHYRMGYQECMSETMRFMVEVEGHFPREGVCVRILNHLQKHCDSLLKIRHPTGANSIPTMIEHRLPPQQQTHETVITQTQQLQQPQQQQQQPPQQQHDYQTTKDESNHNNGEIYDKNNHDFNGNTYSYKYKTNIKLRFNQDLHEGAKRQKFNDDNNNNNNNNSNNNGRRASIASVENHSSSRGSPPISEVCTRISEQELSRISPISPINHLKLENGHHNHHHQQQQRTDIIRSYSPHLQQQQQQHELIDDKTNFNVPIFVLHAKGSYYLPLTIDYKTLLPYIRNYDIVDILPDNRVNNNNNNNNNNNIVLHPVTINVNFQPNCINGKYKNDWN